MTQYLMKNFQQGARKQLHYCTIKFNSINVGVVWGVVMLIGGVYYRVWFVPEAILEKLEPMNLPPLDYLL